VKKIFHFNNLSSAISFIRCNGDSNKDVDVKGKNIFNQEKSKRFLFSKKPIETVIKVWLQNFLVFHWLFDW
jgi:hypothetical protein